MIMKQTTITKTLSVQKIAIKKLNSVLLPHSTTPGSKVVVAQIQAEALKIGFIFSQDAANAIAANLTSFPSIMKELQELVGANFTWRPFYPGFPQQVEDMSHFELFFNAILHYWTGGEWRPDYPDNLKLPNLEVGLKPKLIGLISQDTFLQLFTNLLQANGSLTDFDREVIAWGFEKHKYVNTTIPDNIPFKENMCFFASLCLKNGLTHLVGKFVKTTTDVLRLAVAFSGGDITLVKNTKFKITRTQRTLLVGLLEKVIKTDDILRHKEQWKRLFYAMHVHQFKNKSTVRTIANELYDDELTSFNSKVETAIRDKKLNTAINLLVIKPGEFARRLDKLIRINVNGAQEVLTKFVSVVDKVDTRVLLQVLAHFENERKDRIVIPKGMTNKARKLPDLNIEIPGNVLFDISKAIRDTLILRFSELEPLGDVYVDPQLMKCPIPMQMRTASDGLLVLPRGTKLKVDSDIVRLFIHWVGNDIDLSAVFLDENLKYVGAIAYYDLKCKYGVHSGDITYAPAPNGACEFIDINIPELLKDKNNKGVRYVAFDVRVFGGADFQGQETNFGWMERTEMGHRGSHFDAKTVKQRIALTSAKKNAFVALLDVYEREVIWLDLEGQSQTGFSGNNVHNNKVSVIELAHAAINLKSPTLYTLFDLHAEARGKKVFEISEETRIFDTEILRNYVEVLSKYL